MKQQGQTYKKTIVKINALWLIVKYQWHASVYGIVQIVYKTIYPNLLEKLIRITNVPLLTASTLEQNQC